MKCKYCGHEQPENFVYCPACGAKNEETPFETPTPPPYENVFRQPAEPSPLLKAIKDKLFLCVCILMSACCVLNLAGGGIPLLRILLTVFLWLTYSKGKNDVADYEHLRCVSGTVFASYVINYVLAAMMIVMGGLFSALLSFITSSPELLNEVLDETEDLAGVSAGTLSQFFSSFAPLFGIIFIIIGIVLIVVNYFGRRSIHKFAKSIYQGITNPDVVPVKANAAYVWLIVFGVMNGVSALSGDVDSPAFFAELAGTAAYVIISLLIRKYYLNHN